jgi:radical SAM protein with 4Fe4S-binding SPASM domain
MDQMFRAIPHVLERPPENGVDFVIFGGEPLQEIPALRERVSQIIDRAHEAGYDPRIISNGVGLASAVPMLKGRVALIQVTIDGTEALHRMRRPLPGADSFAPMVTGITRALEAGIRINIRVNTDATNLPTLPDLADFFREQRWTESGLIHFHIAPVKNHNPRKRIDPESELLKAVLDLVNRDERMSIYKLDGFAGLKYFDSFKASGIFPLHRFFHCEAQINFFAFDLHGDIYSCWDAAGIENMAVGRFHPQIQVFPEKLALWRGRNAMDIPGCTDCVAQPTCGGGCQFLAMEHQGTFQAPNCDSLLEGWVQSIQANARWLVDRAEAGDHAVGLVTAVGVINQVNTDFGILDAENAHDLVRSNC